MFKILIAAAATLATLTAALCLCRPVDVVQAAAKEEPGRAEIVADVPILMYHSLSEKQTDQWVLNPAAFEEDLRYLAANQYTAVLISDLVAFVDDGIPLPEKPIAITFDDCYYNNLAVGLPLLEKYNMKMVLSVIGSYSEAFSQEEDHNLHYAHLSWEELAKMAASGRVELANHTWGLHNHDDGRDGCCRVAGEALNQYQARLSDDVGKLQDKLADAAGAAPLCFTYPFGSKCPEAQEVLEAMGFRASLSCYEGVNHLAVGQPAALFDLRRNNRTPRRSAQAILESLSAE